MREIHAREAEKQLDALLDEVECGEAFLPLAHGRSDLEILTPPRGLEFDAHGMLPKTMADWS